MCHGILRDGGSENRIQAEVVILGADQMERDLCGQEYISMLKRFLYTKRINISVNF